VKTPNINLNSATGNTKTFVRDVRQQAKNAAKNAAHTSKQVAEKTFEYTIGNKGKYVLTSILLTLFVLGMKKQEAIDDARLLQQKQKLENLVGAKKMKFIDDTICRKNVWVSTDYETRELSKVIENINLMAKLKSDSIKVAKLREFLKPRLF
jgi:hypothetical protein